MKNRDEVRISGVLAKGYGIMPKMVTVDQRLPIESKAIYAYLTSFSGAGNSAFPSVDKICRDLNISDKRFFKYRKYLAELGYLEIVNRREDNKLTSNLYILNTAIEEPACEKKLYRQIVCKQIVHKQNECKQNVGTNNNNINNNNINNNNINNNINYIYSHFNSKNIIKSRKITSALEKLINRKIKEFGVEEIIKAIDNYSEVLNDEKYFFDTKWNLEKFLKQSNALPDFLDDGVKWINYKDWRDGANGRNGGISSKSNEICENSKEGESKGYRVF